MTDHPTTLRTIEQRVRIAASPETVWDFWTDASRLCEWWGLRAELDPRPGGIFRVEMGDDGPVMSGAFVADRLYLSPLTAKTHANRAR